MLASKYSIGWNLYRDYRLEVMELNPETLRLLNHLTMDDSLESKVSLGMVGLRWSSVWRMSFHCNFIIMPPEIYYRSSFDPLQLMACNFFFACNFLISKGFRDSI